MIYEFPSDILRAGTVAFNPRGMTVSGPPSLTGRIITGSLDAGYWIAYLGGINLRQKSSPLFSETIRLFRAFRALMEGGAHSVRVPFCDVQQAPWPLDASGKPILSTSQARFSDPATFDDGATFYQPLISANVVGGYIAADRVTSIIIDMLYAGPLVGGEYFSIGDRLYVVKQILSENGTQKTISFWPALREDVLSGTEVNFDRPVCRMKISDESATDLALIFGRRGVVDISFVEVV